MKKILRHMLEFDLGHLKKVSVNKNLEKILYCQ